MSSVIINSSVSTEAALNAAIVTADGTTTAGTYEIDLSGNIALSTPLDAINLASGVTLVISGGNYTLNGGGTQRGLFVYAGTVTVENLTIYDTVAIGGAGGSASAGAGGGGAGFGGGLFVAGTATGASDPGVVSLINVGFTLDGAQGGAGGSGGASTQGGGGGGGLGGAGGAGGNGGGGGGGVGTSAAGGGTGSSGSAGIIIGGSSGGSGHNGGGGGASGGGGGGANSGAGGGGGVGGGGGGGFGFGGGAWGGGGGGGYFGGGYAGGGFGGGGGGGSYPHFGDAGGGGFGGGGGSADGGGAGGGFGGGNGSTTKGGGGLGAGGDIFVEQGASLTIGYSNLTAGTVTGGTGANAGSAYGSGIFLQGTQSITIAPPTGSLTTISGVIADEPGSNSSYSTAGYGTLVVGDTADAGTVDLTAANTFGGGITFNNGTLVLDNASAAGTGTITFGSTTGLMLEIGSGDTPTNSIASFVAGDTIDLLGVGSASSVSLNSTSHALTVTYGGSNTLSLQFAAAFTGYAPTFEVDSAGTGTNIILIPYPTVAGTTAGQTTTDEASLQPFSSVTVSDGHAGASETVTITLTAGGTASDADGTLSGATRVGTGTYTVVGSAAAVTTALEAVVFTPTSHQVSAGGTVTTGLTLTVTNAAAGESATDTTSTVIATAVNDAPTIAGASNSYTTTDATSLSPLAAITVADVDLSTTEVATIRLSVSGTSSDANGTLTGATRIGAGTYTLTGLPSALTTALQALVFKPTAHQVTPGSTVTTSITVTASQTAGGSTTSATSGTTTIVATAMNDAPTISGATSGHTTTDAASTAPFSTITIADVDLSTSEVVTIQLSAGDTNGTLVGATRISAGTYTLTGTPTAVTTALEALIFKPTAHEVAAGSTVTTTATIVASQTAGGSTTSVTNSTTTIIATATNDAPTISGAATGKTTTDAASLAPFSSVTVADVDLSTTEIVTIKLSSGDSNGTLTGATWISAGTYTLSGLPSAVTATLEAIVFKPTAHQVVPGSTVTTSVTLVASQTAGGSTTSVTNSTTTIIATAANDAPTIAGASAGQTTTDAASLAPFSSVTVADVDLSTSEVVTLTLSSGDANGTLSGATWISAGTYTLSGSPSAVTTTLEAVLFKPTIHQVTPGNTVTTTATIVASQTAGGSTTSATNSTTTVLASAVNDAPTIAGASAGQTTTDATSLTPFASVTVADVDLSTSEVVTLTLSSGDANGTLTGATWISAGTYTLTGTPSAVTTALEALVFTPTAHQVTPGSIVTTTFNLVASQTAGGSTTSATNSTTTVLASAVNDAPTIAGASAGQTTTDAASLAPFSSVTIADVDLSTSEVVTLTLSSGDVNGTLTGATWISAGTYTLTGTPSAVSTALEALVFAPTAHQLTPGGIVTTAVTLVASQTAGGSTTSVTNSATTIVATAANDAPTIAGASAGQTTTDDASLASFSSVTVADVDLSTSEIVTLTLSSGDANGTLTGATWISAGTYTLSGTPSAVTTSLEAVVFSPTSHQVTPGSIVTTTVTLVASQTAGGSTTSATNSTTTVLASAINDAPTISGATSAHTTKDAASLTPLSTVTVADVDLSTIDIVSITLSSGDSNGTLSGATWISAGTYTLSGTPSAVTTSLEAVVFTPTAHQVTPGSIVTTTVTLVARQTAGGSTTSATNSTTTVIATALNDAPTIAGATAGQITADSASLTPLSGVTIADVDFSTTEVVAITLTSGDINGTLAGATWISAGNYTLSGTPSAVTTALEALVFTPTAHQVSPGSTVTTTATIVASQTAGGTTTSVTNSTTTIIATAANDAPTIAGAIAGQTTTDTASLTPFSGVTIADVDLSTSEFVTLTLTSGDASGTISGATWISAGTYTLSGTPSVVSTALEALVFTPTAHQVSPGSTVTTTATIVASQTAGGSTTSVTNSTTTIIATAANDAPTIAGAIAGQTTTDAASFTPFSAVTVADVDLSTSEVVTLTLTSGDANGTLSGTTWISAGTYTLAGTPSAVSTALEALVFTPTAHQVTPGSTVTTTATIVASQTAGSSTTYTTNSTTTIVATAANDAPNLAGARAGQTTTDATSLAPFSTVTVADVDVGTSEVVTLILTSGDANGTLTGATRIAAGTYTLSGSPNAVTSALEALVFTPMAHQVTPGSTVTSTFVITASQTAGSTTTSATNSTTTIIATALNDAPTIAGTRASQSPTDAASLIPFSGVTIADVDLSTSEILTLTLTSGDSNGTVSGAARIAAGTYTLTGTPTAVTTALQALVFTPTGHQVAPGGVVTSLLTLSVAQGSAVASNTLGLAVTATNDTPTISGTRSLILLANGNSDAPFAAVSINDAAFSAIETLTITLTDGGIATDADGTLSGTLSTTGLSHVGAGHYTLSAGTPAQVSAALQALRFASALGADAAATTVFTISDADNHATSVSDATTSVLAVSAPAAPSISGTAANQAVADTASLAPFAGVAISDSNGISPTETLTVSLSSTQDGSLVAAGGGTVSANGTWQTTGSAAAVTAALDGLVFVPTTGQVASGGTVTTDFTLTVLDSAGLSATDTTTSVIAKNQGSVSTQAAVVSGVSNQNISTGGLVTNTAAAAMFTTGSAVTTVLGGTGSVTIAAGSGGGLFVGGSAGANILTASAAKTTLIGGGSADVLSAASSGGDMLVGGLGAETLNGAAASGADILFGSAAGSTFIAGGSGADTIVTGAGANTVSTAGANTVFLGGGQNLVQMSGAGTVLGGAGADTVFASGAALDFAGSGRTVFIGGAASSTLAGGSGSTTLFGGAGGGVFYGGAAGGNFLSAGAGPTTLVGGGAGDVLSAANGKNDLLIAGAGNETLNAAGSTGAVILAGGTGADYVMMGGGIELFLPGSGNATISGFTPGADYIARNGATTTTILGGNTVLTLGNGTQITLLGVSNFGNASLI